MKLEILRFLYIYKMFNINNDKTWGGGATKKPKKKKFNDNAKISFCLKKQKCVESDGHDLKKKE